MKDQEQAVSCRRDPGTPHRSDRRARPFVRIAVAGVLAAVMFGLSGCGVAVRSLHEAATGTRTLDERDLDRARTAWRYFETGRDPVTGLVGTVGDSAFTTLWTVGDQLAATVAAHRLGIVDARAFDAQVSQILLFLNTMPLSQGGRPGKVYGVSTGQLTDFDGNPADLGWSAVDLGRLLVWLRVLAQEYPHYRSYVANAVGRWTLCGMIADDGRPLAADGSGAAFVPYPETRRGYDAYAVRGFRAWGMEVPERAAPSRDFEIDIYGTAFPMVADGAPVMTGPYVLLGIEFGRRPIGGAGEPLRRPDIPAVQEARFEAEGILTARTDYRRSSEPYVVLDTILADGYPWSTIDMDGRAYPELALLSTRAAFGLWALNENGYTRRLLAQVEPLSDPSAGWLEGRYEASGGYEWTRTAATNAVILEALLYRARGPLVQAMSPMTGADRTEGVGCRSP